MNLGGDPKYSEGGEGYYLVDVLCVLLFLMMLLFAVLATPHPRPEDQENVTVMLRVLEVKKDGSITAQPYLAPVFDLRLDGGIAPKEKDVLRCTWSVTKQGFDDHTDNFVGFSCVGDNDGSGALKKTLVLRGLGF